MREKFDIRHIYEVILRILIANQTTFLFALFWFILIDIFMLKFSSDLRIFMSLAAYLLACRIYSFKSVFTFGFCLLLLTIVFFLYVFTSARFMTERASVWFVLFLLIGVLQYWRELR